MIIENFFLARNSAVDRDTNSLSVFDLVEDINIVGQLPIQIPIQAIVVLKRAGERGEVKHGWTFAIVNGAGKTVFQQTSIVPMAAEHSRVRMRFNLVVPIDAVGVFRFRIERNDKPETFREIEIEVRAAPPRMGQA